MKLKPLLSSWTFVQNENRFYRVILVGLVVSDLMLSIEVLHAERTVVLIPPHLTKDVEVSRRAASSSLKESWGLYFAELMGNVTPGNADFLQIVLGDLLSPKVYRSIQEHLMDEIQQLKDERIAMSFKPRQVFYEAETDRIFVSGDHVSQGPNSQPDIRQRTYEMTINIQDYRPRVDAIDIYPEEPHTLENNETRKNHPH